MNYKIRNSTERNEKCSKIEKELYKINIFRYMNLILYTLDLKMNLIFINR